MELKSIYFRLNEDSNLFFSILIPCYGNLIFLDECLESIEKQNFSSYEIIICDQGETDSSKIAAKYKNVKIIKKNKPSLYLSRIELIKEANGKYCLFCDNDDLFADNALQILFEAISNHNYPDVLVFKLAKFKDNLLFENRIEDTGEIKKIDDQQYQNLLLHSNGRYNSLCQKCVRRSKIKQLYDIDVFQAEDISISLQLLKQMDTFYLLDKTLYLYRIHYSNGTKTWSISRIFDISIFTYIVICDFKNEIKPELVSFCKYVSLQILQGINEKKCGKKIWENLLENEYFNFCYQTILKNKKLLLKREKFKNKFFINVFVRKSYFLLKFIGNTYFSFTNKGGTK